MFWKLEGRRIKERRAGAEAVWAGVAGESCFWVGFLFYKFFMAYYNKTSLTFTKQSDCVLNVFLCHLWSLRYMCDHKWFMSLGSVKNSVSLLT